MITRLRFAAAANVASAETGATADASPTRPNNKFPASGAIDGDRRGIDWGNGDGWHDGTRAAFPDRLQINFNGAQTINEVRVYTLRNEWRSAAEPTETTPADLYGLLDFDVQYWNGSGWVTLGSVTGNDRAMRVVTFPEVTTDRIRVHVRGRNACKGVIARNVTQDSPGEVATSVIEQFRHEWPRPVEEGGKA